MTTPRLLIKPFEETFAVCQVEDYSEVNFESPFVFLGQTDEENSLVCLEKDIPVNSIKVDQEWSAFRIEGVLDFSLVGILAKISTLLAENHISIFALSTFNTDYVLVKSDHFEQALLVLEKAGYIIEK